MDRVAGRNRKPATVSAVDWTVVARTNHFENGSSVKRAGAASRSMRFGLFATRIMVSNAGSPVSMLRTWTALEFLCSRNSRGSATNCPVVTGRPSPPSVPNSEPNG